MKQKDTPLSWSFSGGAGLTVSGGAIEDPPSGETEEQCHQGLKLVLLLEGTLSCELPDSGTRDISGPSLCAVMDRGGHVAAQRFDPHHRLRYIMVTIDSDDLDMFTGSNLEQLAGRLGGHSLPQAPVLLTRKPESTLHSLALQMLTFRGEGLAGARLYMSGKAFELAGLALDQLAGATRLGSMSKLTPSEIERLHAVRDRLSVALDNAPDLAMLARETGLNTRKLTEGFRALFGATPAAWLQARRLDTAHRMIADREWTVSQAAGHVGYTPAAFATAFRRRFGISPSALRS